MSAKSFEEGGYFDSLPLHEVMALVEVSRTTVDEMRSIDRAHHGEHDGYVAQKRKSNSQLELDALVKQYALALSFLGRSACSFTCRSSSASQRSSFASAATR